jgi:hypothetical protein
MRRAILSSILVFLLCGVVSASDLSGAMDTSLSFTTFGSADWFGQSSTFYNDGDAAQSGDVFDSEESWMQTTVSGEGTITFYWKVSSERYCDYLEFYINGSVMYRISGSQDWQQMIYTLDSGSHTLEWRFIKDESVSVGNDCGWVDQLEWGAGSEPPPPPPSSGDLSEALDTTLSFSTGGSGDWFAQSAFSYYDGDAAQSGSIWHNQESWMQTTVDGAGTVSFYWKVSSELNYDSLEFYIDGVIQDQINGLVNWEQKVYTIDTSGSHTLEWRYIKDGSVSNDNDCGWLDQVEWGAGSEPPPPPPPPPSSELSEAMDTTLLFTTGGDADWFGQATSFYYGGDAAQSGDIWDNEESWMQTTLLSGPATLSFYWKVSSESYCDFLEFYVDDVLQDRISGLLDWQQMTYTLGSGSHTLKWIYIKDGSVSAGSDCGWVDQVNWGDGSEPPPPPPSTDLSEAMDTTLSFTTEGSANWFAQSAMFYYGGDAAQSGDISNNEVSWVQTTVTGPGTVSFHWKVSSEGDYDFLGFYIDDVLQEQISGSVNWQQKVYTLGSGSHILEWRYTKDRSMDSGSDCGWVDQVEWEPGSEPPPPPPPGDLSEALDTTLSVTTGGDADWFGQPTISYYGGDAAQSGDILHNLESWMQTTLNGQTTVTFYWKVSSEENSDFLEFYIDDEFQDQISGEVDWQQKTYVLDSLGLYKLDWKYIKDGSVSAGSDCGWVDKLEWEGGSEPPPPPPPPSDDLSEALDSTLLFTTGGDEFWFGQFATFNYGGDAAQSGAIVSNQESWMQTTVSGPTTVSFFWKVSSEGGYDYLEFYIDGERQERISGSTDWEQMVYELDSGSHTLEWRYTKDLGVDNGSDCGWVDHMELGGDVEPPPPPPSSDLSEALDTTLSFTTGGSAGWVGQFSTYYFGEDAAQSGGIWHNQETWIQTTLTGPTTVSFYWKVSSESYYDYLGFYIDGVIKEQISGEADWQPVVYTIPAGLHTLKWRYVKDGSVSIGSDRGWVDLVEFGTDPGTPPPSVDLIEALDTPFSFTTGGSANWFGQTVTSYFDGDAAQSGPISDSQTTWLRTAIEVTEDKTVSFFWKVSSEVGYDYLEFYIDGELQDRITGIRDWEPRTYTILFPYAFGSQTYTFEWRYVKDSSVGDGSDCGWVDMVK